MTSRFPMVLHPSRQSREGYFLAVSGGGHNRENHLSASQFAADEGL
jgi:hypothetical protein